MQTISKNTKSLHNVCNMKVKKNKDGKYYIVNQWLAKHVRIIKMLKIYEEENKNLD